MEKDDSFTDVTVFSIIKLLCVKMFSAHANDSIVQFQMMKPFLNDDVKNNKIKRIRVASSTKIPNIVEDVRQIPFVE